MSLQRAIVTMFALLALVVASAVTQGGLRGANALAADTQVYELRTYTTVEGRLPALHKRFRNHTMKLFEKHGMRNIMYWTPTDEKLAQNTLIYVLAHDSREAAKKSWEGFRSDPDWHKVRTESEKDGPIVAKVESIFMTPTGFSPQPE